jgi:hypothetical protein
MCFVSVGTFCRNTEDGDRRLLCHNLHSMIPGRLLYLQTGSSKMSLEEQERK